MPWIDEFQDTDEEQWAIFSRLFLGSEWHRLFLIGDPKQAIYRFRGADIHTYLKAREHLRRIGGNIVHLDHNYRSSPDMVTAINAVFGTEAIFQGKIRYDVPVHCGLPDNQLEDQGPAMICSELVPPEGEKIKAPDLRDGHARLVAERIASLLADDRPLIPDSQGPRPILPRDIAILTRKRGEAEHLSQTLTAYGIPHAFYKQGGLFRTREAQDLYDVLYAVEHHNRDSACFTALLTDFFNVELGDLLCRPVMPEGLRDTFADWRRESYRDRDLRALLDRIFEETGLFQRLLYLYDDERMVTNLQHIADVLAREGTHMDLRQLLRLFKGYMSGRFGMDEDLLRLETEKEAVLIMTIHAAKGLEFPFVFLYGGFGRDAANEPCHEFHHPEWGRVIDLGKNHPEEHEAEKREEFERLYYVAVTRARYRLYLPFANVSSGANGSLMKSLTALKQDGGVDQIAFEQHPLAFLSRPPSEPETVAPAAGTPLLPATPPDYASVLEHKAGFGLTSYTRLTHRVHPVTALVREGYEADRGLDEAPETALQETISLPGGRDTGICLHALLERITELNVASHGLTEFEAWKEQEHVTRIITAYLRSSGLEEHYAVVADIVWSALNAELDNGIVLGRMPAQDRLHEVDFHYPVDTVTGRRVFLTGSIDLAFRQGERYYFADWKSDTLNSYDSGVLERKVREDYGIQIQIYLWAMLYWLGISDQEDYERRFGGLYYLFLRGMVAGSGICFLRPEWDEVIRYRQDLELQV